MKFKLDENIGRRGRELLEAAGHDVMTVREQDLRGVADEQLFKICAVERRVLITLDHDFGHVLRFPPEQSAGIVILELGPRATLHAILGRLRDSWQSCRDIPSLAHCGSWSRDACASIWATISSDVSCMERLRCVSRSTSITR